MKIKCFEIHLLCQSSSFFNKLSIFCQNMVNKPTENAEKMGETPLKEFPPTFELFFHCFLRLHQLKFLISTGLTFRKISKTPRNPEYGKVRWMDMSFNFIHECLKPKWASDCGVCRKLKSADFMKQRRSWITN